jgi:hypothetical protein
LFQKGGYKLKKGRIYSANWNSDKILFRMVEYIYDGQKIFPKSRLHIPSPSQPCKAYLMASTDVTDKSLFGFELWLDGLEDVQEVPSTDLPLYVNMPVLAPCYREAMAEI